MEEKIRNIAQDIENILTQRFSPEKIEVIDESHLHIGHAGYREGGQSHFKLIIKASSLNEYSRIAKHKEIYDALSGLMKEEIHALSITCL